MIACIFAFLIGAFMGMMCTALCVASKRNDI